MVQGILLELVAYRINSEPILGAAYAGFACVGFSAGRTPAIPLELFCELALVLARFTLRHVPVNSTSKNHLFYGQF